MFDAEKIKDTIRSGKSQKRTNEEIVSLLNDKGFESKQGKAWTIANLSNFITANNLGRQVIKAKGVKRGVYNKRKLIPEIMEIPLIPKASDKIVVIMTSSDNVAAVVNSIWK